MTKPTEKEKVIFLLPLSALLKFKFNPGAVLWQSVANPVQGHFQCPVRCPCTELCPLWGPGSSRGVSIHQGPTHTGIKEFPIPTSLNCSVHTREGAGLSWASALPRQRWEKGFLGFPSWLLKDPPAAESKSWPISIMGQAARMAEPALTQHKNPLVEHTLCWGEPFRAHAKSFGIAQLMLQQAQEPFCHHQNFQCNYSNTHNSNIIYI